MSLEDNHGNNIDIIPCFHGGSLPDIHWEQWHNTNIRAL
nr:MAG TPA_asm: hypothetical protein [Caudoviricetes sp.]